MTERTNSMIRLIPTERMKLVTIDRMILIPIEIEIVKPNSEIFNAYKEGLASYNERARETLNIFSEKVGNLTGCNCFAPIELRKYLPKGTRLSTMADLGRATKKNSNFLNGLYSDTGLVLRTAWDSIINNDLLSISLAKQLEDRGITLKTPKVIYFDALDLKQNKNSAYGLVYELNERAILGENIIDSPELMQDMKFKIMNQKGIPIRDDNGSRNSFTRENGLSRFFLDRKSNVDSCYDTLALSSGGGRVTVVSEAGGRK